MKRTVVLEGLNVSFKLGSMVILQLECDNELEVQRVVKKWLEEQVILSQK